MSLPPEVLRLHTDKVQHFTYSRQYAAAAAFAYMPYTDG